MATVREFSAGGPYPDGIRIGATGEKIGFAGATPIVQRVGAAQAAVTGTIGAALATTAVTQSTPWGFASQAQGDLVTTRLNQALVDIAALTVLCNELRATVVAFGIAKGAA